MKKNRGSECKKKKKPTVRTGVAYKRGNIKTNKTWKEHKENRGKEKREKERKGQRTRICILN